MDYFLLSYQHFYINIILWQFGCKFPDRKGGEKCSDLEENRHKCWFIKCKSS